MHVLSKHDYETFTGISHLLLAQNTCKEQLEKRLKDDHTYVNQINGRKRVTTHKHVSLQQNMFLS